MTKLTWVAVPAAFGMAAMAPALLAQDDGGTDTDVDVEVEPEESNGAIVTRGPRTEERLVVDEEGNAILDENGNEQFETVELGGWVQTVETPSGNRHTITKAEGERAVVTHEFANPPERAERPQRAERPEKPEKPERPEKPEKPGRPG